MPEYNEMVDIIATTLKRDPASLDVNAPLEALGVDSIDVVEVVFALEEKYGITIPFNANMAMSPTFATFGSVIELIQTLVKSPESKCA